MPTTQNTGHDIPEALKNGKYPFTQAHWDALVGQIDQLINGQTRSWSGEKYNKSVYFLEQEAPEPGKEGAGGAGLKEIFTPEMDSYQRAARLVDLIVNEKKPVFFLNPGNSKSLSGKLFTRLTLEGDPPTAKGRNAMSAPRVEELYPEDYDAYPEHIRSKETLDEEWLPDPNGPPKAPNWFKRLFNTLFGAFQEEMDAYQANLQEYNDRAEGYPEEYAKWKAQDDQQRDAWPVMREAHNRNVQRQQRERAQFDSPEETAVRKALETAVKADKEKLLALRSETRAVEPSLRAERFQVLTTTCQNLKELDIRARETLGPSGRPTMENDVYQPLEQTPGVGDEWGALTLGAMTDMEVWRNVQTGSSTGSRIGGEGVSREDTDLSQRDWMLNGMLCANVLGGIKSDGRAFTMLVPIDKCRLQADAAWKSFLSGGDPEPARKLLRDGLDYWVKNSRHSLGMHSNEAQSSARILNMLTDCADRHPELAEGLDPALLQEARGQVRLYKGYARAMECNARLVGETPPTPEEKRELLGEILLADTLGALDHKDYRTTEDAPDFYDAIQISHENRAPKIRLAMGLPASKRVLMLGGERGPAELERMKQELMETKRFQELLAMPLDELGKLMSERMKGSREDSLDTLREATAARREKQFQAAREATRPEPERRRSAEAPERHGMKLEDEPIPEVLKDNPQPRKRSNAVTDRPKDGPKL